MSQAEGVRIPHPVEAAGPSRSAALVRRRDCSLQSVRSGPTRPDSMDDRVHLLVRQQAAGATCEGRHRRSRHTVRDDLPDRRVAGDSEIDGIVQRDRGAAFSSRAVAPSAVRSIERVEVPDRPRILHFGASRGLARGAPARRDAPGQRDDKHGCAVHPFSPFPFSWARPDASIPARRTSGSFCQTSTRACRETTIPATTPNPICESTNQGQSTCWLSTGLTIPMMLCRSPDQTSGAKRPPRRTGCRGSMGRSAPYSTPTKRDPARWITSAITNAAGWNRARSAALSAFAPGKKPAERRLIGYQTPYRLMTP